MFHLLGARVDIRDKNDKTPLHIATENGSYKIVDFFIGIIIRTSKIEQIKIINLFIFFR